MDVLIFNGGYSPAKTYGGPVVSIQNLVKNLNANDNFTIITNSTEINSSKNLNGINVNKVNKGEFSEDILYLDKEHYNYKFIINLLEEIEKFDLIYVNSFFDAKQLYTALKISKKFNIPVLIAPRGELEQNALKIKNVKKMIYIRAFNGLFNEANIYFQATTSDENINIRKHLKTTSDRIFDIKNIPTSSTTLYKNKNKEINKLRVCFISRIQTKKNLNYALEVLKKTNEKYEIVFDIFGPIENKKYWEECLKIINTMPPHVKTSYNGILLHEDIIETFSHYDLFLFPTKSENFGHVISEALFAGCPVILSDQTPWNDINETIGGKAISLNQPETFVQEIEQMASKNNEEYNEIRKDISSYLKNKINIDNYIQDYVNTFNSISKNN